MACSGATLWTFLLPAAPTALQTLITRELVAPTGGAVQYRPLGPWVWLVFSDLPAVQATRPAARMVGSLSEREAAIWVPVARLDAAGRVAAASFFVPWMFVDSGAALTAGREAFGLPKELGVLTLDPAAGQFAVDAETVAQRGATARLTRQRLITVTPSAGRAPWRPLLGTTPTDALRLLRDIREAVPLTQLRQIPAIDDPTRAALVEVVELEARPRGRPRLERLPGSHRVTLADPDLHPLVRALGVGPQVTSPLAARIQLDFVLNGTGTRWSSAATPPASPARPAPRRLLVLGGGLGSLTTLFELTREPDWRSRWDITVLQPGWRLGGKAASSRDTNRADRSEEHGLHIWFGFYRNAFRLVRDLYSALDRPAGHPLRCPEQVFVPQPRVHFHERLHGRAWTWVLDAPTDPRFPGGPSAWEGAHTAIPGPGQLLRRGLHLILGLLRGAPALRHHQDGVAGPPLAWGRAVRRLLRRGGLPGAVLRLERAVAAPAPAAAPSALERRLQDVRARLRAAVGDPARHHPEAVQLWIVAESALAIALGVLRDDLLTRGFDAIDGEDFRTWLARHGAPDEVRACAPLKALYDAAFAYDGGDTRRPDLAAGAALSTVLRMVLTYEGAILWKTTVGMGEAIIAPLYEVLARRGVQFRFFHRVDRLSLSADGARIAAVQVTEQVQTRGPYQPLVEVAGVPCWPAQPKHEAIVDPEGLVGMDASWLESGVAGGPTAGERVLSHGRDFDEVLLGIGLGALPRICGELVAARPAWRAMLEGLPTIATAAAQVWLTRSTTERGDGVEAIDNLPCGPIPSWIDMAAVLATEHWGTAGPRGLIYGAGVLSDEIPPAQATAAACDQLAEVLQDHRGTLCPQAPGWETVHDPQQRGGAHRLGAGLVRANVHGSERYERAASGTAHLRLPPGGSGFANLTLAGAWTRTGLHIGSVEAAVMSGRLAASVLDGIPRHVVGADDGGAA